MADDIQIKQTGAFGSAQTPASANPAGSQGATPAGAQGSAIPAAAKPATENSAVIDLSKMEISQPAAAGTVPVPPPATTAATTKAVTPSPFSLEDAAMAAANQTVAAPPEKFTIPQLVKDKFPNLIQLIKETESMNDEERDYWFQILPIMTEDQISKFQDILLNEKNQLQKLDKEYEGELTKLNEKHMIEWKEFETKEKRKAITQAEEQAKVQEQVTEEDLLKRLSQT